MPNDLEHGHMPNDLEHGHMPNDLEHGHMPNDSACYLASLISLSVSASPGSFSHSPSLSMSPSALTCRNALSMLLEAA
jgi:hypothetical protein